MSIHPSLRSSDKDNLQRSVLKRIERLRIMLEKGKWQEGDRVFGLPKIKTLRIKIKKEKAAEKTAEAVAAEAVAPAASATEKPTKSSASPKSKESKK
ncbi:MAG: small basic protein [Candidatus Omnitrophica bacterium]|nr:small basic protein [Candidatus Omnitrophota bacterium]MBU4345795.1 small basic protein [Candidatus Omnitrophota bacterium]MBU4473446.1 small basic protein [Candidatus Omnitrophota bacterium]MCG2706219.1 small basic protein [Candidatus Omnitrophota bacterium]